MDDHKTLKASAKQVVLWKYQTGKAVYYSTPAIDDDGTLYYGTGRGGTEAGAFVAITKEGALKWSYAGEFSFFSPAIDASGTIYVQDFGYNLFAFQPNGSVKWKLPNTLFPHMVENVGQRCPAIGTDGTIYLPADGLYALSPSMEILWHFSGMTCKSSPVIGPDKTIYVVFGQDRVMAINPNGTKKWENRFTNAWEMSFASPAVDNQGIVYVPSEAFYEGKDYSALYAFNQSNGEIRWKYPTERFIRASPVIGPDRSVYIATKATDVTQTAKLISLSSEGKKNWEYVLENVHVTADDIYSTPAVGADGLIYFGAETGFLYAVRAGNGTLAWKFDLKMAVNWSSPVLLNDGTMYIGGMGGSNYEGYIRAIKTDSPGYAATPWPRFRHDNKNTGRY
jgi:outer membrane protein assembly factor BamB